MFSIYTRNGRWVHLVGLPLRVDHERPPPGVEDDDAIVHAEAVSRQAVDVPLAYEDGIA